MVVEAERVRPWRRTAADRLHFDGGRFSRPFGLDRGAQSRCAAWLRPCRLHATARYAPQAVQQVAELIRQEQACCAFLTFEMHEAPDAVTLTITAPGRGADHCRRNLRAIPASQGAISGVMVNRRPSLGGGVATTQKEAPELRGLIALGSKSCVFRGREVGLGFLHAFELNDRYTVRRLTYSSDRCLPARYDLGPVGVARSGRPPAPIP